MSDIMRPMPFAHLMDWILREYESHGSIFGVSRLIRHVNGQALPIFSEKIEAPFGPAAGPNTQLSQNIIAAYVAGSRFFELKTVQIMDGRELAACVPKPCINAADECYNCEWSTELEVPQAMAEYVKAWFACKLLARELELGDPDGFVFNMSVGYDLAGIQSPKIDAFIEGLKDASDLPVWQECVDWTLANLSRFTKVDEAYVRGITPRVSNSITESTLHGCPPDEIERIATYLITEKNLNTYIKCNPTLLGYDFARDRLDRLGFGYIAFDDHHFREDLQWADAVPMFRRLIALCAERGLEFGLKLTNTFPVDVKAGELPSEEMYMSGRSLYALTIHVARRITDEFDGKLRISYSGGADFFTCRDLFDAGIWPITMATTVLKPGGYQRFAQIADELMDCGSEPFSGVSVEAVRRLDEQVETESRCRKPVKPLPDRKIRCAAPDGKTDDVLPDGKTGRALPLIDCFRAPCRVGCPIGQDIPGYLRAMNEGRSEDALAIILERNPLPFITGTLCPHHCGDKCMRNYYESTVHIRETKLAAALAAYDKALPRMQAVGDEYIAKREAGEAGAGAAKDAANDGVANGVADGGENAAKKVAVIGGGPAGLAAAYFLSRAGVKVTVFERRHMLGGVVRLAIPEFRISGESIDKDIELCKAYGAKFCFGIDVGSVSLMAEEGYTDVIIATGAWKPSSAGLKYGEDMDALHFLDLIKNYPGVVEPGKNVVVIGGGNTAMDVARAAKRLEGVEQVRLVYRRNRRYMPADEEELEAAQADGVEFCELLSPIGVKDGVLTCGVMALGAPDETGRRSPVDTGKTVEFPADLVISAVGEGIETGLYEECGVKCDRKGRPLTDEGMAVLREDAEASGANRAPRVYAIGDARRGPATVVEAIADAAAAAAAIAGVRFDAREGDNIAPDVEKYKAKKGILRKEARQPGSDGAAVAADGEAFVDDRCLGCPTICAVCADVCPNRANVTVRVPGLAREQIIHVDGLCNECGNCAVLCPYNGRPYMDKFTLFWSREDFDNSSNEGFLVRDGEILVRLDGAVNTYPVDSAMWTYPVDDAVKAYSAENAGSGLGDADCGLPEDIRRLIAAVLKDYGYLIH